MRLLTTLCVAAWMLICVGGCGRIRSYLNQKDATEKVDTARVEESHDPFTRDSILRTMQRAEALADSAIAGMNVTTKGAQMLMPAIYASHDAWTMAKLREYADMGVGGIILLKGDLESAKVISDSLHAWSHTPPFIAIDAEFGLAMRLKNAPDFPLNADISADATPQLMFDYGREVGREARLLGINMVLGPVLDVAARNSVMGIRSLGTDPKRVATLAVAYARGLESAGVVSVAKHFPGHGAAEGDSHLKQLEIEQSLHYIDSIHLYPFRKYIDAGLSAVMVGHLAFPAIDPKSLPAAVSPAVITDLLRNDLGFKGIVITDALNMKGARGIGAEQAVLAGADLISAPKDTRKAITDIVSGVKRNLYSESAIDRSLRRVLVKKYLLRYQRTHNIPDDAILMKGDTINSQKAREIKHRLVN